jgi:hypothetical protein
MGGHLLCEQSIDPTAHLFASLVHAPQHRRNEPDGVHLSPPSIFGIVNIFFERLSSCISRIAVQIARRSNRARFASPGVKSSTSKFVSGTALTLCTRTADGAGGCRPSGQKIPPPVDGRPLHPGRPQVTAALTIFRLILTPVITQTLLLKC